MHNSIHFSLFRFAQRLVRGYIGRSKFITRKRRTRSQILIAKLWRAYTDRQHFQRLLEIRQISTLHIQCFWRKRLARRLTVQMRLRRNASMLIQRMHRGFLGRRYAKRERDKFIFSRSQSAGIEFGRQILTEHKLHATKLQSEISLLNKDKERYVEIVDELLDEIELLESKVQELEESMQHVSSKERIGLSHTNIEEIKVEKAYVKFILNKI